MFDSVFCLRCADRERAADTWVVKRMSRNAMFGAAFAVLLHGPAFAYSVSQSLNYFYDGYDDGGGSHVGYGDSRYSSLLGSNELTFDLKGAWVRTSAIAAPNPTVTIAGRGPDAHNYDGGAVGATVAFTYNFQVDGAPSGIQVPIRIDGVFSSQFSGADLGGYSAELGMNGYDLLRGWQNGLNAPLNTTDRFSFSRMVTAGESNFIQLWLSGNFGGNNDGYSIGQVSLDPYI